MTSRFGLGLLLGLAMSLSSAVETIAAPAAVFTPYIDRIRQRLPPNFEMRLPAEITLGDAIPLEPDEINQLVVRIFSTPAPARLTVSLFTCESSPFPCLVGSFAVDSARDANAQRELNLHRARQSPISLASGIEGYYRDGTRQTPPSDFSSVMWQQNDMIYTVSFLAQERQNILNMAASMARESPIR